VLDLAPLSGGPVKVHFRIPLEAERIDAGEGAARS